MTVAEHYCDKRPLKHSLSIYDAFRGWQGVTADCPGMGPNDDRRRANADNSMTEEEAAMEAMAANDYVTTAKVMMRGKNLLLVKMVAVAEAVRVDTMATKV